MQSPRHNILLYGSGTTVRDRVSWQLESGAPFQISWNMPTDSHGFVVQDTDIIRMEHSADQVNLSAVSALRGGAGHMSQLVRRLEVGSVVSGRPAGMVLVMDFPSADVAAALFESDAYRALVPVRDRGFTEMSILLNSGM